jgi:hypothetical protein
MSVTAALLPRPKVSAAKRVEARLAVLAARVLARSKPWLIRALLVRLASGQRPASRPEAQHAWEAVLSVSKRCAGRRGCLVRSLAIVLVCRWHGSWPTWCVGVRAVGLSEAHAWVEAEGAPVGELPGTAAAYRKVLSVGVPEEADRD